MDVKFHALMAVWGDAFVDTMMATMIPSLLHPGNLPALAPDARFVFITRAEDETRIRAAAPFAQLAALMPIDFLHFRPEAHASVYLALGEAHRVASERAKAEGAAGIFLHPDGVFAAGSLASAAAHIRRGMAAVVQTAPRLHQERAEPILRERIKAPLSSRELVALMYRLLHPEMARNFANSHDFSTFPTVMLWGLGHKGMMVRAFHLHPLMVNFAHVDIGRLKHETIDAGPLSAVRDWNQIHIETDSDNLCSVSLTPTGAFYSESDRQPFKLATLRKAARHPLVGPLHRHYFGTAIRLHTRDLDEQWAATERRTAWLADAVSRSPVRRLKGWLAHP